jgi:hypothetical protein
MQSIFYKPFEKEFIHRLCITFKKVQNICPVFILNLFQFIRICVFAQNLCFVFMFHAFSINIEHKT